MSYAGPVSSHDSQECMLRGLGCTDISQSPAIHLFSPANMTAWIPAATPQLAVCVLKYLMSMSLEFYDSFLITAHPICSATDSRQTVHALYSASVQNPEPRLELAQQQYVLPCFDVPAWHERAKACWMTQQSAHVKFADARGSDTLPLYTQT